MDVILLPREKVSHEVMEQNIAILIADLSGYTALTETHGAFSAADLIDKYISIVKNSLVGDSHLHERVGDEVLIVSDSPDFLIETSMMLVQNTMRENNFLQIHGGMHYGKILKRNNSYFGSAINLTSRIASQASPGTFWCSEDYISALSNQSEFKFLPKGKYSFKNVNDQKELFEIITSEVKPLYVDPVCRMLINIEEAPVQHPITENIFFCSKNCLEIYLQNETANSIKSSLDS